MKEEKENITRLPTKKRKLPIIDVDIDEVHSPEVRRKRTIKAVPTPPAKATP